jgi:RNA polymerase sigma-70 factor (ECF subfamily)
MDMLRDTLAEVSDETLVVLYANGDSEAAGLLTARLLPRVWRYAARVLSDASEADDLAQEAMLRLWRIAPVWRTGEAQVSTWMYRVVVNLCNDRLRMRKRTKASSIQNIAELHDGADSVETGLIKQDRCNALDAALAQLPNRQRQAVVLRHIEEMTNPEIAEVMELGVEAVESLIARGKRGLTLLLSGQKAELGYEGDE